MNKRASMSLGIIVMVMLTVLVIGAAVFSFLTQQNGINKKFYNTYILEDTYSKEYLINFYIQNIINRAARISELKSKEDFILALQQELGKYKDTENVPGEGSTYVLPELEQFEKQISPDRIEINGNTAKISTEFSIINSLKEDNKEEILNVKYTYIKVFETKI